LFLVFLVYFSENSFVRFFKFFFVVSFALSYRGPGFLEQRLTQIGSLKLLVHFERPKIVIYGFSSSVLFEALTALA